VPRDEFDVISCSVGTIRLRRFGSKMKLSLSFPLGLQQRFVRELATTRL
jgi:hypothetical protein